MALLISLFLVILLAYQCADVVNGAAQASSLPDFVKDKEKVFNGLKDICQKKHGTRVVARADLKGCRVTCAKGVFNGLFGSDPTVRLESYEPCDTTGQCMEGQCVYIA